MLIQLVCSPLFEKKIFFFFFKMKEMAGLLVMGVGKSGMLLVLRVISKVFGYCGSW
jgi:hypothetical protein